MAETTKKTAAKTAEKETENLTGGESQSNQTNPGETQASTGAVAQGVKPMTTLPIGYVLAKKGGAQSVFSPQEWKLLGHDKGGWTEVVPVPPEVLALNQNK